MENNAGNAPAVTNAAEPQAKTNNQKGLIAAVVTFAILALAGIGFGIFMFISTGGFPGDVVVSCNERPDQDSATTTDVPEANSAPSISEVEGILKNKYEFANIQSGFTGIFKHLDDFDENTKIGLIVHMLLNNAPGESSPDFSEILKNISYEELNKQYQFYFGNDSNIAKEDLTFTDILGLIKMEYDQANDNFIVHFADGLGGVTFIYQLNKVIQVKGSQDKFTATVVTVDLDTMVSQSADEYLNTSDYGGNKFYDIIMPEETLEEIQESLSAYDFNFIKEDGEPKLISIEKL